MIDRVWIIGDRPKVVRDWVVGVRLKRGSLKSEPLCFLTGVFMGSGGVRRDVVIKPEEVGGVVVLFNGLEAIPGSSGIGAADPGFTFVAQEIDVNAAVALV